MSTAHEDARLNALHQLDLLDTAPSEAFDRITRMASQIFDLPIAAVSLTDRDRQWFKSRVGVDHTSIPRDKAPCAAVAESNGFVVIPDLLADPCYADSPLATSGIRFYAGAPLTTREGFGLGALCVLGTEPRTATDAEMASLNDLSKIVMSQIELQHAFGRIDPMSGLPNRIQFLEDIGDLARDHPGEAQIAVLVDLARNRQLDHGMRVMGPSYIDEMVREAGRLIKSQLLPGQTAYHVAATQFAFLAPAGMGVDELEERIPRTVERLSGQSGVRFTMTAAIGIAPFVLGATTAAEVLRSATGAAQDARALGQTASVYSPSSDKAFKRSFRLLSDFPGALEEPGQLRLVFQPRIDLASGRCIGAEALLRWLHPALGSVSPAEFIPIIEETELARPVTAWVIERAAEQLGRWAKAGLDCHLSVNVTGANLDEVDFTERTLASLLRHGIGPGSLEMEITESAAMSDGNQAMRTLSELKEAGFTIAIDDFGTGYSSLAYLQRLPASVLKIDQSFIRSLSRADRRGLALVGSTVRLAHEMGYRVVAEGVETEEAAGLLREIGCEEAQGYFFARPLETADFERFFRSADAPGYPAIDPSS